MPSTRVPAPPTSPRLTSEASADSPVRLLDREHLPVVIGIIALVTLAAFENRAVMTILPTVVRELDGWALFGASTGAPLVTFTVAMAWSGTWTDRVGPRPVLHWGLGLFVLAQAVSALAPTMAVFVAGRAVSGAAEALIDTSLMVLVAQAPPEHLRAKVFATFAVAWILPSLLGPSLAGGLDALAGWRVVFLGPLLVAPLAYALMRPALARTSGTASAPPTTSPGAPDESEGPGQKPALPTPRAPIPVAALLLAAGLAVTTFAAPLLSQPATRPAGIAVIGTGACSSSSGQPGTCRQARPACTAGCRPSSRSACSSPQPSPRSAASYRSCSSRPTGPWQPWAWASSPPRSRPSCSRSPRHPSTAA
ncbi:MFS transporter [Ornithinibacter aureus]|nr:MFS transporter [Ornithinibacter aureus]KAF0834148.1 MFS transporter [Ornithinibacter aureus]